MQSPTQLSLSYPYSPPKEGYWMPITATINWCEQDYYATPYIAEFVNTLTNLLFFYLGTKGMLNVWKHGHDMIFLFAFAGYVVVGTGSFLFHASLKYPMQLIDELSMIYTTSLVVYAMYSFSRPKSIRIKLGVSLISLCTFITLYYHYLQDPRFHEIAYGVLTAVVVFQSMWTMEVTLRPSRRARFRTASTKTSNKQRYEDERDSHILRMMWLLVGSGLTSFLGAFLVWNIDNRACSTLSRWRNAMGLPWGMLLELHGWWHILSGLGAYIYIVWGVWLRQCMSGKQDECELRWPSIFSIPELVKTTPATRRKQEEKKDGTDEDPLNSTTDEAR